MNQHLPGTSVPPVRANDDFTGLFPPKVFPTQARLLEQGDHLLVIKQYDHGIKMSKKQRYMWKLLTRFGRPLDAPGSIEVVCVWKIHVVSAREVIWFDHTGVRGPMALTTDEYREMLLDWWDRCAR